MELEQSLAAIRAQGLGLAAISYDSPAVLKNFADRKKITFPLLSDPESKIIRAFGILNEQVPKDNMVYGIPYPGTYLIDPKGVVTAKYFEDDYTERYTAGDILIREFGTAAGGEVNKASTKHLTVSSGASLTTVRGGQTIALVLDIDLQPGMHVYAPGVEGYIPIAWSLNPNESVKPGEVQFPKPEILRLEAINETVPVFTNHLRLIREVTFAKKPLADFTLEGSLRYQACDDKLCYNPQTVLLKWAFHAEAHDRERVPENLQRKAAH